MASRYCSRQDRKRSRRRSVKAPDAPRPGRDDGLAPHAGVSVDLLGGRILELRPSDSPVPFSPSTKPMTAPRIVMPRSLALLLFVVMTHDAAAQLSSEASDSHTHVSIEPGTSLTLHEVVLHTAAREPGTGVVTARRNEADALLENAGRLLPGAPSIAVDHVTDRIWTNDGYRQWGTGVELPLWWPGQRSGRRDRAQAAGAAADHSERAHLLEVAGWVRQAVAELALAQVRLELAEAEWRAEDALADQIERAVAMQEFAERDLLLARSSSLNLRFGYLEALEEFRHAEGNYSLLAGLTEWPADWAEAQSEHSALRDHPLLLLADEETARAEAEVRRLIGDQWGHPVLTLGTQHERDIRGDDYSNRVVTGLRIPLGRRRDAGAEIAAAQRVLAETRRDAHRLERELRGTLAEAEHRLALADKRVATATEQTRMAAEYRRLSERGFGLGETDLGALIRARARAASAEQTLREAVILRLFSTAQLNQATGVIP